MSEEAEDDERFVKVRVDHYNEMRTAADLGFEVLVARRNALGVLSRKMTTYPDRDSSAMKAPTEGLLDGIPLDDRDLGDLVRRYDDRIRRTADALNANLNSPRYK